ncbi:MAG: hypothetical protein KAT04_02030 [Methylococcales bacterium]|nr:hypothetical protein [Methylococcales bacterium]
MTIATLISISDFGALVEDAFHPETPVVSSSESELGQPLQHFATPVEILAKAKHCIEAGIHNYAFGLWYPSMKGGVLERKVVLDPPREGESFRYSMSGWGIIYLHLYVTPPNTLQCRVAVNSEARARSREGRYPEMGATSEWDWRVVETYAFRLTRRLASMGRTVPVVNG